MSTHIIAYHLVLRMEEATEIWFMTCHALLTFKTTGRYRNKTYS